MTAEILLVCRRGPPSLAACEEEAFLAWPLPGSPPPMLGSLTEPYRLHPSAPCGADAAGHTRLRYNAQSTHKSQISHPGGRCGTSGNANLDCQSGWGCWELECPSGCSAEQGFKDKGEGGQAGETTQVLGWGTREGSSSSNVTLLSLNYCYSRCCRGG